MQSDTGTFSLEAIAGLSSADPPERSSLSKSIRDHNAAIAARKEKEAEEAKAAAKAEEKPEEKKEPAPKKMKKWPDRNRLVNFALLVKPIKDILERGYRLTRLITVNGFDYDGYNIGKEELEIMPSPRARFSDNLLEYERKRGKSLFDVALNVIFLLGVEQGRRAEKQNKGVDSIPHVLERYREDNKNLRLRNDTLAAIIAVRQEYPTISNAELDQKVADIVKYKRNGRMIAARKDLSQDPAKSSFRFVPKRKTSFKELQRIAAELDPDLCTDTQWKTILKDKGWSNKEWKERCSKKNFTNPFNRPVVSEVKATAKQRSGSNPIEQ